MENTKNKTCFNKHKDLNINCKVKSCKHWFSCRKYNNCSLLAAKKGPRTLQQIGDLHGLTRMRICQIEKIAIEKIKRYILNIS
mgnify:FL=1|jgi:hypothetical protein